MLITTQFKANDIVTLKLLSGEEVITKFLGEDSSGYRISKPLVLSVTSQGVAMTPFLLTAELEAEILIPKNSVIVIVVTEKMTANQYIKGTTGIEPATSKIIV